MSSRKEQWKTNYIIRRQALLDAGGRLLPVLLEKEHSDMLDQIIALRREHDPRINMTAWVRKMIVADLRRLRQRREAAADARSTSP